MISRKRPCNQSGAAMVEFAIVLPLVLLILFGTIEFGLLLYNQQVITNASREGARAGIVAQSPRVSQAGIEEVVRSYCEDYLITFGSYSPPETAITGHKDNAAFQEDLTVLVAFDYTFLVVPAFFQDLLSPLKLRARTTMKYE